jgi:glycine hydroxymethyltransferase
MTTRGFGTEEFTRVAELIDRVLEAPENEDVQQAVEREVNALCDEFPLYDVAVA